jgi:predicted extracellular nuclease
VPLAQLFSDRQSGERFLVVVNHLKSKGYCPESGPNTDQGDGQACWNPIRTEGARETVRWARKLAEEGGTDKLVVVGDFNAYRLEEPILNVQAEGLVELVERHNPGEQHYSYIYRGAAGTLDYAFASKPLADISTGAFIWHINAAYPWSGRPSEPWLRCSDHDPVIVDLSLSQSATLD